MKKIKKKMYDKETKKVESEFSSKYCLPACRRLLFPLLHAEKGRLRNAVANRVPAYAGRVFPSHKL